MMSASLPPLTRVLDLLLDAVCVVDVEGRYLYVNKGYERIFGYAPADVLGRRMIEFVHPLDRDRTLGAAADIMDGNTKFNFRNRYMRKDGSVVDIEWSARWFPEDAVRIAVGHDITDLRRSETRRETMLAISEATHLDDDLPGAMARIDAILAAHPGTVEDAQLKQFVSTQVESMVERSRYRARLEHLVGHDPLTSLANRSHFNDRLESAMRAAGDSPRGIALLYLDLDGFKHVNDRFGHASGDLLLREVATRLRACIRSTDVAARVGGDEFVVMLQGVVDSDHAWSIADDIRLALLDPFDLESTTVQVSASIGIALQDRNDAQGHLLRQADAAMYAAKRQGGNRIEVARSGD